MGMFKSSNVIGSISTHQGGKTQLFQGDYHKFLQP